MDAFWSVWQAIEDYVWTYFENFGLGIHYFFTLENILANLCGAAIGLVLAALPGITGVTATALVLPFVFGMEPMTAISLLLGTYVGAIFGGAITAILFNTPGTPASVCTAWDGFCLTQKGKGGKALDLANWASCVGDLTSTIVVIIVCPLLGMIAMHFSSVDYFAIILFSITMIAGLAGRSFVKGLIPAALGFLVATVGMDPLTGKERFCFGSMELMGGFSLVPIAIGLFAISEVMLQLNESRRRKGQATISAVEASHPDDKRMTWTDFKGTFRHMIRGGFVGLILGIIPGLGPTPAAFVSYERARRSSKHPEDFGKGSLEGIAAAEAGNNAVNGATLVPLLTLGIPGDIVTAIMLGALVIFGIQPGPFLFVEHADLVFGIFCALIMSDVSLRLVSIMFIRYARKVATVPTSIIFPVIVILCFFGSYAVSSNIADVFVMLVFGIVGYLFATFEMPAVPFVIAYILGPLLERGLARSLAISGGSLLIFFKSPLAVFFFMLTTLSIISIIKGFVPRTK